MNLFEKACSDAEFMDDMKLRRGYGEVYHLILEHLGTSIPVIELGVGGGSSHVRWVHATSGPVIGLEIAGPEREKCTASLFTGDNSIVDRQIEIANLAVEAFSKLPQDKQQQLDIRFYTDAYDPQNASAVKQKYDYLPFIVNDSKHAPHLHKLFRETWADIVSDNGILVQEDIARWTNDDLGYEEPKAKELIRALDTGWHIYQFVDYYLNNEDGSANHRASLIGLYFTDPQWHAIMKPLENRKVTHDNYMKYCTGD